MVSNFLSRFELFILADGEKKISETPFAGRVLRIPMFICTWLVDSF
jgi:hypothetical protein